MASIATAGIGGQSHHLRWLANWVRATVRTRTRLLPREADVLLCGISDAFDRLDLSPEAGQRLASLLDELAAQAVIQAPAPAAIVEAVGFRSVDAARAHALARRAFIKADDRAAAGGSA